MLYNNLDEAIILTDKISLSKIDFEKPDEMDFVKKVFKSTRYEEMRLSHWPADEVEKFLEQQFQFQHLDYTSKCPDAQFYLIKYKGENCGRLYIHYREKEIRIIDIALTDKFRNKKIGSAIINILKNESRKLNKPLSLHVENYNKAQNLYKRLEFKEISNNGVYILMEYSG